MNFFDNSSAETVATNQIVIVCKDSALIQHAEQLAARIAAPLFQHEDPSAIAAFPLALIYAENRVSLIDVRGKIGGEVSADFVAGKLGFRRHLQEAKPLVAKAVGVQSKIKPTVWDMTAGLGQDAYVLAQQGCSVKMFERHPVVHELLRAGLAQTESVDDEKLQEIIGRMSLSREDSLKALQGIQEAQRPDVIYLDPMFPERSKTAKVKKGMQMFHELVGPDADAEQLLPLALAAAKYRVVVKRSKQAPPLNGQAAPLQFQGKTMRFDVYPLKKMSAT